ncbi:MAG TPA: TIGR02757 family protein [Flavobacterium sp.]
MNKSELKDFLDEKVLQYNRPSFITTDPIQIPHRFSKKQDIEIAGFLSATIAWGNRKMIISNSLKMMEMMEEAPHDFVMTHSDAELERFNGFVHRTFNGNDLITFIRGLRHIYTNHGGMENVFSSNGTANSLHASIHEFKKIFFEVDHLQRTQKHISDPLKGSAAKRLHMMLRWFVRRDNAGVDFGIWKSIPMSALSCPLDVHSGNVARKLGLLTRKQNDAKALLELDTALREFDPEDPSKYDFALFGLGVFEKF